MSQNTTNVPDDFYCPITGDIMVNPVMDLDGISYEEVAILKWLETKHISPLTRNPLLPTDLRKNLTLKNSIESIKDQISDSQLKIKSKIYTEENIEFVDSLKDIKLNSYYSDNQLMFNIKMPDMKVRPPVDITLCIDVSGSMATDAPLKGDNGKEVSHGISVLSLTVCAAKTIMNSLNEKDNISIITYSNKSSILIDCWSVSNENKVLIDKMLDELKPTFTTNIWDGIKTSLDILRTKSPKNRMKGLFLLTDGVPNIEPSRGHEYMLEKYFTDFSDFKCMINCYGFGYSLRSDLLQNISNISGGDGFAFIPDSSLLGNIFIHGLSNFLTTASSNVTLTIKLFDKFKFDDGEMMKKIKISSLKYGQDKNIMFDIKQIGEIDDYDLIDFGDCELNIDDISIKSQISDYNRPSEIYYFNQHIRYKAITCLDECIDKMKFNEKDLIKTIITSFLDDIKINKIKTTIPDTFTTTDYIKNIIFDFEGQVKEALNMTNVGEKEDWFSKWGVHYLRSLSDAYKNEVCNNFKDKGVSNFGGDLFHSLVDKVSDIFDTMPPPKKTLQSNCQSYRGQTNPAISNLPSMASYNYSGGGCCAKGCRIKMSDGSYKKVEEIIKGDEVITVDTKDNNLYYSKGKIECVVNTECDNGYEKMVTLNNLKITPYHPIIDVMNFKSQWNYPINIHNKLKNTECSNMFTFVINNRQSVIVEDFIFATYGHGLNESIINHEFFGTDKVINDLKTFPAYKFGMIYLNKNMFMRGKNGNVNKIKFKIDMKSVFQKIYLSNL